MSGSIDFRASDFRRDADDRNTARGNTVGELLDQYDLEKFHAMVKANKAPVEVKVLPDLKLTNDSVFQPIHVVESGESLWSIARKELREAGLATSDRDVAKEVKRIIEVNCQNYPSLKNNPNLIQKGWILELPSEIQFDVESPRAFHKPIDRAFKQAEVAKAAAYLHDHVEAPKGEHDIQLKAEPEAAAKNQVDNKEFGKLSAYEKDVLRNMRAVSTGKMFPSR